MAASASKVPPALSGAGFVVSTPHPRLPAPAMAEVIAALEAEIAGHGACHPEVIATSAETGAGIPELRAALAAVVFA